MKIQARKDEFKMKVKMKEILDESLEKLSKLSILIYVNKWLPIVEEERELERQAIMKEEAIKITDV